MTKITDTLAADVESRFLQYGQTVLDQMKLNVRLISVGGKFTDEGIMLELGLVHKDAGADIASSLLKLQIDEGADVQPVANPLTVTGYTDSQLRKFAKALLGVTNKYDQGERLRGKKGDYTIIGYSNSREKCILWSESSEKIQYADLDNVKKLKRI